MLRGVLGSGVVGVKLMAGHEKGVHGQPFCLGEFTAHAMLDFQSDQLRDFEKILAGQMGNVRVAEDLFHEISGILRHLRGPDTSRHLGDPPWRITLVPQKGGGDLNALFLVALDRFHITRIVKPCRKHDDFEGFRAEVTGCAYGLARPGNGFGMLEIVILHPIRLGRFEKRRDVSAGFLDKSVLLHTTC